MEHYPHMSTQSCFLIFRLLSVVLWLRQANLLAISLTNLAEYWVGVWCKFDGGKVVNRSQSGSWEFRCMGAGLRANYWTYLGTSSVERHNWISSRNSVLATWQTAWPKQEREGQEEKE